MQNAAAAVAAAAAAPAGAGLAGPAAGPALARYRRCPAMGFLTKPVRPTPEIPVLEDSRVSLTEAMLADASPFALITMLDEVERDVSSCRSFSVHATMGLLNNLREKKRGHDQANRCWDIFHSIPREVLQSLVLGTTAYDAANGLKGYKDLNGAGVYVLGVSIANRQGKFLNLGEMEILVKNMGEYLEGARLMLKLPTEEDYDMIEQRQLERHVQRVDSQFILRGDKTKPAFVKRITLNQEDQLSEGAIRLSEALARRCDAMRVLDPTGTVHTIQAPLYVGCGKDIAEHVKVYEPKAGSAFASANLLYGLLLSLLQHQGLRPVHHIIAASRLWEEKQMSDADRLISALAMSFPDKGGLNNTQPGAQHGKSADLNGSEDYVCVTEPYYEENIKHSLADLEARKEAGKLIDKADEAWARIEAMDTEDLVRQGNNINRRTREIMEKTASAVAQSSSRLEKDTAILAQMDGLRSALKEMANGMPPQSPEEDEERIPDTYENN
ncbi:hypothetical protein B0T16DRAFT_460925 [Cercophora newfieldiana]|uniref:Uncharacterized protein n=1 Tax=Cercophora newfieldiana TaxID=92897 RepID=A0AA40CKV3_9PEZI|nr:hypothetical protein B0T16DRAFT_460925 [Cercophora newfieldiana]